VKPLATRPFRVLGVQQVAIGGADKTRLMKLWHECLGLEHAGSYRSETENVDEEILSAGRGAFRVEIDVMQPIDATRAPHVERPALNHVGLWVDNLVAAHAWLTAEGMRFAPGGLRPGAAGHAVCFIHPKGNDEFPLSGEGVLIELVQAPASLIAAFDEQV
jgi:lactoylglutathione lyase